MTPSLLLLAAFPEYFYDVERILLRLAVNEVEQDISNNASTIWQQLFRVYLSGTSVPFPDRIALLRKRVTDNDVAVAMLAVNALESTFARDLTRMGGPSVIAGRIPPPEWQPRTQPELTKCYEEAFQLLDQALDDPRGPVRERAADLIVNNIRFLLSDGRLDVAKRAIVHAGIEQKFRPKILDQIADFMSFDAKQSHPDYVAKVNEWRQSLIPREDRFELLQSIVGRARRWTEDPLEEQQLNATFNDLASQLFSDRRFFERSVEWLSSEEANYAFEIGEKLGRRDSEYALFETIKTRADNDSASLVRGYIYGFALAQGHLPDFITKWLDELDLTNPLLLYRIASSIPQQVDGLTRLVRLVKKRQIPPRFLNGVQYRFGGEGLSESQISEIFDVLLAYQGEARQESLAIAIDIASSQIHRKNPQQISRLFSERVWPRLQHIIRDAMPKATMDVFHWSVVLKTVLERDPKLVIKKAVEGLAEGIYVGQQASAVLLKAIGNSPERVMDELGNALLDEKNGWRLQIHGFENVLIKLPTNVVLAWLNRYGATGARKLASNLPQPFVAESGEAIVPELTQNVLERYGTDEEVIKRFILRGRTRSYSGDIVGQHLHEAEVAARFLNHPIEAVRKWAQSERDMALAEADHWRQHIAEERW